MDKPCQAQPFSQEIMGDKHQTSKSIVGNKGYPNPSRDPTVSQAAHSAAMSPFESYIFSYSNLTTLKDTPSRGQLIGIVRPLWIKVTESECRIDWLQEMVPSSAFQPRNHGG